MNTPLAERLRPNALSDYISQQHLVGEKGALTKVICKGLIPSMILWGPPGIGKTTLANIIAKTSERPFYTLSAINSGVKEVREVIEKAKQKGGLFTTKNPILFIDEIHRFSKSQQDSLLGAVEQGIVTLIGATTENPSFEVNAALLSRAQVYVLKELTAADLKEMVDRAVQEDEILSKQAIEIQEYEAILQLSGGDGRKLYNILELVTSEAPNQGDTLVIDNEFVRQRVQENLTRFDKGGEQHYDIASAFIKSIRGSDPNAAVYWLARLIEGGEDVKFIARRLIISAAEDIGLANPNALLMATTTAQAVQTVGWPESRIILSQATVYLATSPKSNASYMAINIAQQKVKETGTLPIPLALRNAPTKLMKELDYGSGYKYAHDYDGNFVNMEFLPEKIAGTTFYKPQNNPSERKIWERLKAWWKGKYGYK